MNTVSVFVTGATGSGKSAICGERLQQELTIAKATSARAGEMLDRAVAALRAKEKRP